MAKSLGSVLDIETCGTDDGCKIVSIGAIIFDEYGDVRKDEVPSFHVLVDLDQPGRTVDPGTMKWWEKTAGEEARNRAFSTEGRVSLDTALQMYTDFIRRHKPWYVWACAPDFDMGIMEDAYNKSGGNFPVQFWRYQDVRTIENFIFGKNTRKTGGAHHLGGVAHDALDDCLMEALVIQQARQRVGKPTI